MGCSRVGWRPRDDTRTIGRDFTACAQSVYRFGEDRRVVRVAKAISDDVLHRPGSVHAHAPWANGPGIGQNPLNSVTFSCGCERDAYHQ
ncbi:hypothetical protein C0Z19_14480 [Trinickia soli]|uniref:Uncharacterized protein n=1 Tax=Trinickia soli TaxID=380675 RepID=A0A2N7W3R4_9BURK|nr:hypothetical protein CIW54_08300 [Paraburkholderia sp. T12-10]PMS24041.1 hypothetical protein C0Z19_14480 [Trinickia soli]